jgi:FAD/FMN-containing dehydrogenase
MSDSLSQARGRLGNTHVLTSDLAGYATDWRGMFTGLPLAVCRPADTPQVAALVPLCAAHGVSIVS